MPRRGRVGWLLWPVCDDNSPRVAGLPVSDNFEVCDKQGCRVFQLCQSGKYHRWKLPLLSLEAAQFSYIADREPREAFVGG